MVATKTRESLRRKGVGAAAKVSRRGKARSAMTGRSESSVGGGLPKGKDRKAIGRDKKLGTSGGGGKVLVKGATRKVSGSDASGSGGRRGRGTSKHSCSGGSVGGRSTGERKSSDRTQTDARRGKNDGERGRGRDRDRGRGAGGSSKSAPKRKGSTQKKPALKRKKGKDERVEFVQNENEFVLNTGDIEKIRETTEHDRKKATLRDYRARIFSFISYIETEYPQYYDELVIDLGPNPDDPDVGLKYFGYKKDLVYSKLTLGLVKGFMAKKKVKKFVLPKGEAAAARALAENPT